MPCPAPAFICDDVPGSLLPAVELLSKHGFILVEYGQRALPKYGYPVVVSEYAIADNDLQSASDLLAQHGFPYVSPDPLLIGTNGDFEDKARYHRSLEDKPENKIFLQLLPLSITYVSLDDLQYATSNRKPAPTIYRLSLPQHCISLVRCIASYPYGSNSRNKPVFELSELVAYAIFEYEYYSKDWDQPEESEEEYKEKVRIALMKVGSWILPESTDHWRKLLETLVDGTRQSRDIPYEPHNREMEKQALEEQSLADW